MNEESLKWFNWKDSQYFINFKKQNFSAAADACKTHSSNVAVVNVGNIRNVYEKVRDTTKSTRLDYLRILTNESSESCYAVLNLFLTLPSDVRLGVENVCDQHQNIYQQLPTLCEKLPVPSNLPSAKPTFKNNTDSYDNQALVAVLVTVVFFILVCTGLFTLLLLMNSSSKYQDEAYNEEFKLRKNISRKIHLNEEYKNVS